LEAPGLAGVHRAFGPVQPEHREGVKTGWTFMHEMVRLRAERSQTIADSSHRTWISTTRKKAMRFCLSSK
jgi:hypothetical protein